MFNFGQTGANISLIRFGIILFWLIYLGIVAVRGKECYSFVFWNLFVLHLGSPTSFGLLVFMVVSILVNNELSYFTSLNCDKYYIFRYVICICLAFSHLDSHQQLNLFTGQIIK